MTFVLAAFLFGFPLVAWVPSAGSQHRLSRAGLRFRRRLAARPCGQDYHREGQLGNGRGDTHDVDEAVLLVDRVVMMTNGPAARIGEDRRVSLARPRNRIEVIDAPEYAEVRSAVIHFLHELYRNPATLAA